ncbi:MULTISPECIES: FixH family protein [Hyphobacterium]|uniref:FixH family protein n=1 Tax=Hyphobacterium vulgare TaxID=1736751 RepID=A0ABV7A0V6_9PROT
MIKRVTGWHVLAVILVFFGVIITVNVIFIIQATRTFRGEDQPRSYVQGLDYNSTLAARAEQAALGWTATAAVEDGSIVVHVLDADGHPIDGLDLNGTLRHPADTSRDEILTFQARAEGRYVAALPEGMRGRWQLRAWREGEPPFTLQSELWLQ